MADPRPSQAHRASTTHQGGLRLCPHAPSTATAGWPTPRYSPTSRGETAAGFWDRAADLLRRPRHRGRTGAHRQRQLLPLQRLRRALGAMPRTPSPGPTDPQTNGKVERFNRTLLPSGPMPGPGPQRVNGPDGLPTGSTSTTITGTTPPSEALRSVVSAISQGTTSRSDRARWWME